MKARIAVSIAATVGCVGLIAGAAYAVTVLEWVMPASKLQLGYAAALEYSSRTAESSALDAQARAMAEPGHESGQEPGHQPSADDAGPSGIPGNVDDQPATVRK